MGAKAGHMASQPAALRSLQQGLVSQADAQGTQLAHFFPSPDWTRGENEPEIPKQTGSSEGGRHVPPYVCLWPQVNIHLFFPTRNFLP